MKALKILSITLLITIFLFVPLTYSFGKYNNNRSLGSATTDDYGNTRYYDTFGRSLGSATTDDYGTTRYYDACGMSTGSSTTDDYGNTRFWGSIKSLD